MGFQDNVNVDVRGAAHIAPCTYKTVVLKQNITKQNLNVLTQAMLDEWGRNTKFIIKWDYVLTDGINVPKNCLIEFDGGSIDGDGYTLTGNDTILIYDLDEDAVMKDVVLAGTFVRNPSGDTDKKDNTDGMAKIYLKKDKPFSEQLTQENTIYVIKYDFTLDSDVTVPANCVLEFDGGSISAGSGENMDTITGTDTGIQACLVKIFNTDITLDGSWNIKEIYPQWFYSSGKYDDAINKCIDVVKNTNIRTIYLHKGSYYIDNMITIDTQCSIIGDINTDSTYGTIIWVKDNTTAINITSRGVTINNLFLRPMTTSVTSIGDAIAISGNNNKSQIRIENVSCNRFNIGIRASNIWLSEIINCTQMNCNIGIYINGSTSVNILWNYANTCEIGYQILNLIYSSLIGCCADGNDTSYKITSSKGIKLDNCASEASNKIPIRIDTYSIVDINNFTSYQNNRDNEGGYGITTLFVLNGSIVSVRGLIELDLYKGNKVEVTPVGTENPKELGWLEYIPAPTNAYVFTSDTTVQSGKTYYDSKYYYSVRGESVINGRLCMYDSVLYYGINNIPATKMKGYYISKLKDNEFVSLES